MNATLRIPVIAAVRSVKILQGVIAALVKKDLK